MFEAYALMQVLRMAALGVLPRGAVGTACSSDSSFGEFIAADVAAPSAFDLRASPPALLRRTARGGSNTLSLEFDRLMFDNAEDVDPHGESRKSESRRRRAVNR